MQRPGTKRVSANRKSLTICHVLLPSRRNLSSSLLRRSFSHPDFQIRDSPVNYARIWRSSHVHNGGALLHRKKILKNIYGNGEPFHDVFLSRNHLPSNGSYINFHLKSRNGLDGSSILFSSQKTLWKAL